MEPADSIQQFVEFVVRTLADRPEQASVSRREEAGRLYLEVRVEEEDLPRLLGRGGNTVMALRHLAVAAGARQGLDLSVEVLD